MVKRPAAVTAGGLAARELSRSFEVPEREPGVASALRSLVRRHTRMVQAVDSVTFDIAPGEVVGFLGPNGAGKTTTIKMLAGLLHPTSGTATVLGYTPSRRDHDYLRRIALVMGNRRIGGCVTFYGASRVDGLGVADVLTYVALLPVAVSIVYGFFLAVTSLAFRLVNLRDLLFRLFQGASYSGRWPLGIYPAWLRIALTVIVPIGLAVTIPSSALAGRLSWADVGLVVGAGVTVLVWSRWVFRRGARAYSGASV